MGAFSADFLVAFLLAVVCLAPVIPLAKRWSISILPVSVLFPVFVSFGIVFFLPVSPWYVFEQGGYHDGLYYLSWAEELAGYSFGSVSAATEPIWPGKGVWPAILSLLIISAGGPVTLSPIVLNSIVMSYIVLLVQRATCIINPEGCEFPLIAMFGTFPSFLVFGALPIREAVFWLGVVFGVLSVSYAFIDRARSAYGYLVVSAIVMVLIRPDAGVVIWGGFATAILGILAFHTRQNRSPNWARSIVIGVLVWAVIFWALAQLRPAMSADSVPGHGGYLSRVATTGFGQADELGISSASLTDSFCQGGFLIASSCAALINSPHFFFGPFLWEFEAQLVWALASFSTLHFLVVLVFVALVVARPKGHGPLVVGLLLVAALSVVMFSSILMNYGILIRFRTTTELILMPLAIEGFIRVRNWGVERLRH
jgi:hypothetical protein